MDQMKIKNSNQEIPIHLTVKEILSLAGEKFCYDHPTLIEARKKIKQQLEQHQQ